MRPPAALTAASLVLLAALSGCGDPPRAPDQPADPAPAAETSADAAAAGLAAALAALPTDAPRMPLDIVLIIMDTQRADRLGCYGYPHATTPDTDAYAASGVRVEDVTAQSSWTAPSMVSLMLSRHVADNFVRMPPLPTLAERLAAVGYRTAAFVDNILLAKGTGFDRGFEVYEMEPGPKLIFPVLHDDDPRPLFAYFHFVDPHDPYAPLPAFDQFSPEPLPDWMLAALDADAADHAPDADGATREAEVAAAAAHMSTARALYAGDVRQGDQRVRFVREALASSGRTSRALVIYGSDHGECLWEHREAEELITPARRESLLTRFKMTHNSLLYEELTRVPLIFSGGGLPAGRVLPGPAENVDIVPTILDLLGLPIPAELEGRSLLPDLTGSAHAAAPAAPPDGGRIVRANTAVFTSVRDELGWKLIVPWNTTGGDRIQLFDLNRDPHEQAPIEVPPAEPAARAAAERLARALADYRRTGLRAQGAENVIDTETRERMEQLGYLGR